MLEHFKLTLKSSVPSIDRLLLIAAAVISITSMIGRDSHNNRPPPDRGWSIAMDADPSSDLTFVVIRVAHDAARQRDAYDNAVQAICRERTHKPICVIGFYAPNDRTPSSTKSVRWGEGTPPVVIWRSNENSGTARYTAWDCERGPVQNAPLSALCGRGIKEAYKALVGLAMHRGIGEFCQWPQIKDTDTVVEELFRLAGERGYQEDFQHAYNEALRAGRSRSPGYDCPGYQRRVEAHLMSDVAAWKATATKP